MIISSMDLAFWTNLKSEDILQKSLGPLDIFFVKTATFRLSLSIALPFQTILDEDAS